MNIEKAVCPNCGALIEVDSSLDAAICPICHAPFVVAKAIEKHNSGNTPEDANKSSVNPENTPESTNEQTNLNTSNSAPSGIAPENPVPQNPTSVTNNAQPPNKKKNVLISVIVAIAIIAVLGGSFAVYWFALRCEHSYDYGKTTVESTCIDRGVRTYTCYKCGKTKKEKTPISDHDYERKTILGATCTKEGTEEYTCRVCNDSYTKTIKMKDHYYRETDSTATCTKGGKSTYTCNSCKDTYTKEVKAKGHDYRSATCTKSQECKVCKKKQGKALGHKYVDCECTRCGKVNENDILNYIDITRLKYKINSADGVELYIQFVNKSNKTIKYVNFTITPYNRVGDKAYSEIGDKSTVTAEYTGPLEPGYSNGSDEYWLLWYNNTITSFSFDNIKIEYTDGTSVSFSDYAYHAVAQWRD